MITLQSLIDIFIKYLYFDTSSLHVYVVKYLHSSCVKVAYCKCDQERECESVLGGARVLSHPESLGGVEPGPPHQHPALAGVRGVGLQLGHRQPPLSGSLLLHLR